jgi:hypothetical protein
MNTQPDFEELLRLFEENRVAYLVIDRRRTDREDAGIGAGEKAAQPAPPVRPLRTILPLTFLRGSSGDDRRAYSPV